jgi:hypothetical protein
MGIDRGQSSASRSGGVLDERGKMRLHPLDQRLAPDGAGDVDEIRVRLGVSRRSAITSALRI